MPDIRSQNTTRVTRSRELSNAPGDTLGFQVNVHGLVKLDAGITGEMLLDILIDALKPAEQEVNTNWPILTGASISTVRITEDEIGEKHARASIKIGGPPLEVHRDNPSRKDYAPYIEFNGSPAGRGQGTLTNAFLGNEREMKRIIKERVAELIAGLV